MADQNSAFESDSQNAPLDSTIPLTPSLSTPSYADRHDWQFRWTSACHAVSYLSRLPRHQLREPDKGTERLLVATLIVVAALLFTSAKYLAVMIFICDVLFGTTLLMFIINRFGFLNTLTPKQAYMVWELILGVSLLAIFFVVHMAVFYLAVRCALRI